MKIVVDCNVVVSAGISDGACAQVVQNVLASHAWIVSIPILDEYEEVCRRPRFKKYQIRFTALLSNITSAASLIKPEKISLELPDPDDVIYIETAYAANADILITGNSKDFPKSLQGMPILTPREFLSL